MPGMKKSLKPLLFTMIFLGCMAFVRTGLAQAPPPPPAEKGSNTNKAPGGGAPIEGSVYVVLALAAGFGVWKWVKRGQVINN